MVCEGLGVRSGMEAARGDGGKVRVWVWVLVFRTTPCLAITLRVLQVMRIMMPGECASASFLKMSTVANKCHFLLLWHRRMSMVGAVCMQTNLNYGQGGGVAPRTALSPLYKEHCICVGQSVFLQGNFLWTGFCFRKKTWSPIGVCYPPTAIRYPLTAVGYPLTAVGYPPTTAGYPPTAVGYPPTTAGCSATALLIVRLDNEPATGRLEFFFSI